MHTSLLISFPFNSSSSLDRDFPVFAFLPSIITGSTGAIREGQVKNYRPVMGKARHGPFLFYPGADYVHVAQCCPLTEKEGRHGRKRKQISWRWKQKRRIRIGIIRRKQASKQERQRKTEKDKEDERDGEEEADEEKEEEETGN